MITRTIELSSQDRSVAIRLPINPKDFELAEQQLNQQITLLNMGEVNLQGNRGLLSGTLASFFPSPRSPFWGRAEKTPQEYVADIKKLKDSDEPARLIVSDSDINIAVLIDKITYTTKEGDDDIYYSIDISEYRQLNVPTVAVKSAAQDNGLKDRPNTAKPPQTVTVRSQADTLWAMACKYYGDGTKWTTIAKHNNISDPRSLKLGQVVAIP